MKARSPLQPSYRPILVPYRPILVPYGTLLSSLPSRWESPSPFPQNLLLWYNSLLFLVLTFNPYSLRSSVLVPDRRRTGRPTPAKTTSLSHSPLRLLVWPNPLLLLEITYGHPQIFVSLSTRVPSLQTGPLRSTVPPSTGPYNGSHMTQNPSGQRFALLESSFLVFLGVSDGRREKVYPIDVWKDRDDEQGKDSRIWGPKS